MPRGKANKLYRTFTKGLITEAGYLTYPENASIDELNTVIKVKGSRSRRLGIDYEPGSIASSPVDLTETEIVSEFAWKGVGNDSSVNFLVLQINGDLHFYNLDSVPITDDKKSFTVDLTTFASPTATTADINSTTVQMACGKGLLFVCSEYIDPIVVEYDADTDTITALRIIISIRDFDGVDDDLGNEDQPTTLTAEHLYNLRNQGWVKPGYSDIGTDGDSYTPPAGPTTTTPSYINSDRGAVREVIP